MMGPMHRVASNEEEYAQDRGAELAAGLAITLRGSTNNVLRLTVAQQ